MIKDILETVQPPFLIKSIKSNSEFDDWINGLRKNNRFVTILRGERMQSYKSLYHEIAASLQFPYYFENNWNSLNECIRDLEWLSANVFIIGITNSELILSQEDSDDCYSFGLFLKETCEIWARPYDEDKEWGRPGKPFHIIIQRRNKNIFSKLDDIIKYELTEDFDNI